MTWTKDLDKQIRRLEKENKQLQAELATLQRALALTKSMLCSGESFTAESRLMIEQALKGE